MKRIIAGLLASAFISSAGWAQDRGVWLQVEALPTLSRAQDRARLYDRQLDDVSGYALRSGWYGIALGPYPSAEAARLLRQLKASGTVPADSFIADGDQFSRQFWPIGVRTPGRTTTASSLQQPVAQQEPETAAPNVPDETRRQALAAEGALSRPEREKIQIALRWAGVYDAGIDGAFGRGTRSAMADWQSRNGFEATGVLTTSQRAALLRAYDEVLEGIGMKTVENAAVGIAVDMPTDIVSFSADRPPFSHYDATGDTAAQVLLISQQGNANRLAGLYEILQTLEIVPVEGPRKRNERSFVIEGADATRVTHVEAGLVDGEIKGFALVWPAGDEQRRIRVLDEMKASFRRLPGTLDPAQVPPDEEQAIDLVAGLEIRTPLHERSGFYVDDTGTVATAAAAVEGCGDVAIDGRRGAEVLSVDADLGLALLRPDQRLAPRGVATFQTAVPRLRDRVAVGGFPYGGALSVSAVTFGTLADIRGLDGEETLKRLEMRSQPGDVGGPVFDAGGAVLGLLLPGDATPDRVLPEDVALALESDAILPVLKAAGIEPRTTDLPADATPEALTLRAADMTVLVSCWE